MRYCPRPAIPRGLPIGPLALLALGWLAGSVRAQTAVPPKGYLACQAKAPILIDGKLDDASWAAAAWTDAFVDIEGDKKPRPRFETRAKMLWDQQFFYVAAELKEPHVSGTLTAHDTVIFQDNDFEIFIDPDGDNQNYYEVEINALSTEWDLRLLKAYRDGGPALNSWEIPGLKTATQVQGTINDPSDTDTSWTVEFAIPWKALGEFAGVPSPPRDGDQWRVNFSRVEWEYAVEGKSYRKVPSRPEANWVWSPQGVIDMHQPEHWGFVQFSTAEPGAGVFRHDPAGPARDYLMRVYRAQRAFRGTHKVWAGSIDDLGAGLKGAMPAGSGVAIKLTPDGYEARLESKASGGTWVIRQDSRLRREPAQP